MKIQQLTVGVMGVCCYIVSCEKTNKAAIIDPGGDEEKILDACNRDNLEVIYIIATHGHPDHVCSIGPIQKETGAKIIMHKADAEFFGQPEVKSFFSQLGLAESPPPDILVEDGDTITIGDETLSVIHTPGHTPGGICLYNAPDCITGDTLFVGGVGRTDFPGGSMGELSHSIKSKLLTLPPNTVVWPGHGYGGSKSTIGEEARSNPYF
ncbi:MAG: MBL fold metallo-hydrolase [Thermodesulfobacteriota bacterium]|nr:MBL fold metallo-hydrolase [Thermodesulfobacteriota bacterium]